MTKTHAKTEKPRPSHRHIIKKALRLLGATSLPEIMLGSSLVFGRYLVNAEFQYPSELLLPLVGFGLMVSVIFFIYKKVLGDALAAHVASMTLSAASIHYTILPNLLRDSGNLLLPKAWETWALSTAGTAMVLWLICAGLGLGAGRLVRRVTFLRHLQPLKIVLFVVTFVCITQVFKVASRIYEVRQELAYRHPSPSLPRDQGVTVRKPDVYYLVFDRYASNQTLKDIYQYDNSALTDFLGEQGFVTREQAYANYPFTMQSITSTLALGYHDDLGKKFGADSYQGAFAYRDIFQNPPIAQILKHDGYTYNQISSWWDFTRMNIQADTQPTRSFRLQVLGKAFFLSDLERDFINQSIVSPWLRRGVSLGSWPLVKYDLDRNPRQSFYDQMQALKTLAQQKHTTPQFTFAHILAPHDPYIFDADGSEPSYNNQRTDTGLDEREKYTRQLTYINTQIKSLITHIRTHSPNAAIIIQPDEGPYPKEFRTALSPGHYYDPADLGLPQMKQKTGILASYYMPGIDAGVVKDELNSSVNAFRFVLKHYLGYNIQMLPDCIYSTGNKFVIYRYEDITERLKGTRPAGCDHPNTP